MKEKVYTVLFTMLVTAFFVGAVSGLDSGLAAVTAQNRVRAERTVILRLFGLVGEDASPGTEEINTRFDAVREVTLKESGGGTYTYYRKEDRESLAVIPISGPGFWAPIAGYMALDLDAGTVRGIDFTQQEETPGLGGRIVEDGWREQFVGKSIDSLHDGKRIRIVQTPVYPESDVQAITGATETSRKVEALVNDSLARFIELVATQKEGAQ